MVKKVKEKDLMEEIGGLRSISYVMGKLDCGRTKIYSLVESGDLEVVKLGKRTKVTERSLQRLLRELVAAANETNDK